MSGLAKICKMYGRMFVADKDGNKVEWVYDYAHDKPRLKSEMTKEDWAASEKAKYTQIKKNYNGEHHTRAIRYVSKRQTKA